MKHLQLGYKVSRNLWQYLCQATLMSFISKLKVVLGFTTELYHTMLPILLYISVQKIENLYDLNCSRNWRRELIMFYSISPGYHVAKMHFCVLLYFFRARFILFNIWICYKSRPLFQRYSNTFESPWNDAPAKESFLLCVTNDRWSWNHTIFVHNREHYFLERRKEGAVPSKHTDLCVVNI